MAVTEKLMAQGSFSVQLDYNKLPNSVLNTIDAWDQIVIVPSRVTEDELNDSAMLNFSRICWCYKNTRFRR